MGDTPRAVITQPEDGSIDIPHEPEAEAALVQEMRERVAMLETHVGSPEGVMKLKEINDNLEWLLGAINKTENYECECEDRHDSL